MTGKTTEVIDQEVGVDAEFDAGFDGIATPPTETPEAANTEQTATHEPEPQPKMAQITEEQFNDLLAKAKTVDDLKATQEKAMGTAFGKIGGIERVLQQLQSGTPTGQPVEITAEDVEDLTREFPELGELQLKVLQKVAGKLRGTGGEINPEKIGSMVQEHLAPALEAVDTKVEQMVEKRLLRREHPDWEKVVKEPEFADWLKAKPADFQDTLNNTWDSQTVADALTEFKASKKQAESRRSRFEDAVQPKGDGGITPAPSGDEDFEAGYNGR